MSLYTSLIPFGAAEPEERVLAYCRYFRASCYNADPNKKGGSLIEPAHLIDQHSEVCHYGKIQNVKRYTSLGGCSDG